MHAPMHAPIDAAHHAHHHPSAFAIGLGIAGLLLFFAILRRVLRRRFGPPGRRRAFRWLFRRLDTSVSQEAAIREAIAPLFAELEAVRRSGRDARVSVAHVMRGDVFDGTAFDAALDGPTASARAARRTAEEALARVHAVLSPEQRGTLAGLLERGLHRLGHRHGGRRPTHG